MRFPSVAELAQSGRLLDLGLGIDIRGWHSTDTFFEKMIGEVKPKVILEVGSWRGASALHMAGLCDAEIYCIDTWLGGIDHVLGESDGQNDLCRDEFGSPMLYHQFLLNIANGPHAARIRPVQQTSLNGMRLLKCAHIQPDLIYLDGSHHEDDVFQDLRCAWSSFPKMKMIFGDDFNFPPVANAVNGFAKINGLKVEQKNDFWRLILKNDKAK